MVVGFATGTYGKICRALANVEERGECLIYLGRLDGNGYAIVKVKEISGRWVYRRVHRMAWIAAHGALTRDQHVLHTCDTPACVNQGHHYLGDQVRNMLDMKERGRGRGVPGNQHTKGRVMPESERIARSISNIGVKRSEATCVKQAEAAQRRWDRTSFTERRRHMEPALRARIPNKEMTDG